MRTKEELPEYYDAVVRANGNREITGPVMNSVLKETIASLSKGIIKVPTETLTADDVGKVIKITTGAAVICSHIPGTPGEDAVPGVWRLVFGAAKSSGATEITYRFNDLATIITPVNWNTPVSPYPDPTNVAQELANLEAYFNTIPNVTVELSAAESVITIGEDNGGTNSNIEITEWAGATVEVQQEPQNPVAPGTPYLEEIPSGVLAGVQDGEAFIFIDSVQYFNIPGGATQGQKIYVGDNGTLTTVYHWGWCYGYALTTASEEVLCPVLYRPEYYEE